MNYCIDPNSEEPIMLINTYIGGGDEDEECGIIGADFQRELMLLDTLGKKRIQVWINSEGGSVLDGYNIGSAILRTKTPVDTYNVGICASIAGVIFMCGRNRVMADYSLFMTHPPSGSDDQIMLDKMQQSLVTMMTAKSNITLEEANALMTATSWLNAEECKEKGFATEIEYTASNNKKRITATNHFDIYNDANKFLNNKYKKENMKNVKNQLGLSEDASEQSVIDAIALITNKAKTEKEKMAEKMAAMEKDLQDSKNAFGEKEKAYNTMKEAMDALEDEKVNNLIENFASVGRIKNEAETITKWKNLAKNDFEGTKLLIEDLPLNATAKKIVVEDSVQLVEGSFMANALKEIRNKIKK